MKTNFNSEHYLKVKNEREKKGLVVKVESELINSDLVGKEIKDKEQNRLGKIIRVFNDWYCGYYLRLVVSFDDIEEEIIWEAVSCQDQSIIDKVEAIKRRFEIIDF